MTTVPPRPVAVIGGVDSHADVHVAAACDLLGGVLGTESFPTTPAGYRRLLAFLTSFGPVKVIGVEGTGSYGAGLARYLADAGVRVVEVNRPNRQVRRRHGTRSDRRFVGRVTRSRTKPLAVRWRFLGVLGSPLGTTWLGA